MPAISRLQKVHNVDLAFHVLKEKGVDLKDDRGEWACRCVHTFVIFLFFICPLFYWVPSRLRY